MADTFQSNSSEGQSTSVPQITPTPQSDFSLDLARLLQQLGQQQYQWAQQEYARAGRVTDAQINNFIGLAQQGTNLAGNLINRYTDQYAPLEDQYARDAQMYDSDARRQHEMGAAEARAQHANKAAQINAENELESFGIDPSSGRYQDLVLASNTKAAADAAAAGEAARIATEQQGQQRKLNAIAIGQQLPGAGVNALQSAYTGVSGAVNSALGLANAGANLTATPTKYLDPALRPLQPLQGQNTQQTNASRGMTTSGGGSGSGSGSGAGAGRGGGSPSGDGRWGGSGGGQGGYNPMGGYGGNSGTPSYGGAGYQQPDFKPIYDVDRMFGRPPVQPPEVTDGPWLQPGLEAMGGLPGTTVDPWNNSGDVYQWGQGGQGIQPGDLSNTWDTPQAPADWGGTDMSAPYPDANWGDSGGFDQYSGNYDTSYQDSSGADMSSQDYYGSDAGWGDYAQGGPVRPGGGYVPPQMSPSGGAQTDDIQAVVPQSGGRAQINAGEFVLPRDVVAWKGQEFFQNMIKKARQARTGAPAKPSFGGGRNG